MNVVADETPPVFFHMIDPVAYLRAAIRNN
jgi:hypothetical protein